MPKLEYYGKTVPATAERAEIAPGVTWIRMPLPFALNHINLWLLDDEDGWAVVDTGFDSSQTRSAWQHHFTTTMEGREITAVAITHYHPDHFGLAGWLHRLHGAPVAMTRTEWVLANSIYLDTEDRYGQVQGTLYAENGLDKALAATIAKSAGAYRRSLSVLPDSYHRIQDGQEFVVGGRSWKVVIGAGHSPEHACFYCSELDTLISGDMVLPTITPNITLYAAEQETNPLAAFFESLRRLKELPETTLVLPSHGRPFYGLHRRVDQIIAHHKEHLATIIDELSNPKPAAALLPVLFSSCLDIHQSMFAMGEVMAHLAWLEHDGQVTQRCGSDGILLCERV